MKKKKAFGRRALKIIAPCIIGRKKKLKIRVVILKEIEEKGRKYIATKRKEKKERRKRK